MKRSFLRRRSFWSLLAILPLAAFPLAASHADEAVRAVQTTLKAKGYFYDDPDGSLDLETHNAIRRFQIHEGLPVNGELDGPTAKALGVAAPGKAAPGTSAPSKSPVARGESAGPPQESDREYLHRLEEQTPAERVSVRPTPEPQMPAAATPPAPAPLPSPVPRATPVVRPTSLNAEVTAFVSKYLVAGASPDVDGELGLYANTVDYFNNGRVNRSFIRRDTTSYRRRWPRRDYLLEGKPTVTQSNADGTAVTVRFRIRYRVQAGLQSAAGRTESTMELEQTPEGNFVVVSIKEASVPRS